MRLPLLLLLIAVFTVAWATLAVIRDYVTSRNTEIHQAVLFYQFEHSRHIREIHQREVLRHLGQEVPPVMPDTEPELPEWVKPYVEMQENGDSTPLPYKVGLVSHLAVVPSGWFHGAFGVMILVLCLLSLAEVRSM